MQFGLIDPPLRLEDSTPPLGQGRMKDKIA